MGDATGRAVKGVILAAGFGQRMAPITETLPKPLLPVGNLPLIVYAVKLLAHHGITDIGVNLHYLGRQLKDALGDGSAYGVRFFFSEEVEILGTGGGLKRMHQFADETLVVVNSDTIIDLDVTAVVAEHRARGALATMVLRDDPRREEFGQIEIDAETGRMCRILGQGPIPTNKVLSRMFTGVHVLEPRFLDYIPLDVHTDIIRYGYAKALSNHEPIFGTLMDTYWADAGTPQRYYQVNADALAQRMPLRHADPLSGYALAPRQDVADAVRMGEHVTLGPNTQLRPPVLLGEGTRVGDKATVGPGTIVGQAVQIGKDASLSHCVVLDGARIEAGERLESMLIGKKSRLSLR
jgi:NDP-sugar pyrophosphorylase family protein